jgi:hypothetical protein
MKTLSKILKTKKTKKKFYDKWDHKVSLLMMGAAVFRMADLNEIEQILNGRCIYRYQKEADKNRSNILLLVDELQKYEKNLWQLRIERDQIDVYTNNRSMYDSISEKFLHLVIKRFEPDIEIPLTNGNVIKANRLPHNKFRYKVYLRPHKLCKDYDAKERYLEWITGQSSRISISESVKTWFMHTDWNWDRRYIWVEDESTLLMLKLRNADVCGKVYEYQLCDK